MILLGVDKIAHEENNMCDRGMEAINRKKKHWNKGYQNMELFEFDFIVGHQNE